MKCATHPGNDAVATCQGCSRGLCLECSKRFNVMKCAECLLRDNSAYRKRLKREIFLPVIGGLVLALLFAIYAYEQIPMHGVSEVLQFIACLPLIALIAVSIPFGWRFIRNLRSKQADGTGVFFFNAQGAVLMYGFAVFFYFLVALASIPIGLVVGPWQIWKNLRKIKSIDETERDVQRGLI